MAALRPSLFGPVALAVSLACAKDETSADDEPTTVEDTGDDETSESGSESSSESDDEIGTDGETDSETGPQECTCAPGTDLVYVLGDGGELLSFDPLAELFTPIGEVGCGSGTYYSMAVDHDGMAWLLDLDTRDLLKIDLADPSFCTEPPWVPGNGGFQYFGMGFVTEDAASVCERLYMLRYTGDGAFAEGPDIGAIGVYDPLDGGLSQLATIDYDGGEINGTGDGRLFAFAGVDPAKLIEYDQATGEPLTVLPLDDLSKTTASAFAFHSGDLWFFTEAAPVECEPCLAACTPEYAACQADPDCAESLACMLATGELTDECGGLAPMDLQNCVITTCFDECFPAGGKVSEVHRLDWDQSDGGGQVLSKLDGLAPVRVVGAGVSVCAPFTLP